MQIAVVGAGFTPEEADRLRRSLATFRQAWAPSATFRDRFISGHAGATGMDRRPLPNAAFRPDRGVWRIRVSRKPCSGLCHAGLCLGLAEMPSPGRLCLRPAEFPADGLLRPGPDRARCPRTSGRGAPHLRQCQPPGTTRWSAAQMARWRCGWGFRQIKGFKSGGRRNGSLPPAAMATADPQESVWLRAGLSPAVLERLAEADGFADMGLTRRDALWQVRAIRSPACRCPCSMTRLTVKASHEPHGRSAARCIWARKWSKITSRPA